MAMDPISNELPILGLFDDVCMDIVLGRGQDGQRWYRRAAFKMGAHQLSNGLVCVQPIGCFFETGTIKPFVINMTSVTQTTLGNITDQMAIKNGLSSGLEAKKMFLNMQFRDNPFYQEISDHAPVTYFEFHY